MIHLQRILFPVDFSEACEAMAPSVRGMAQRFNASVTLLNAFNAVPEYIHRPTGGDLKDSGDGPIPYSPALLDLRERCAQDLKEFSRIHFSDIAHSERVEDGDPAIAIEWVAAREDSDLIMMPTKGLGRFRRLLLGSVAAKVLHDIPCPVWTSAHEPDPDLACPTNYRSILCALGPNAEEEGVFQTAGLFAKTFSAKICLLHIQSPSDEQGKPSAAQSIRQTFDQAFIGGDRGLVVDACVRILDADRPESIRKTAYEVDADLLIVGRGHARESFSRAWSNLYTIIRGSRCPVLSV